MKSTYTLVVRVGKDKICWLHSKFKGIQTKYAISLRQLFQDCGTQLCQEEAEEGGGGEEEERGQQ